MPQSKSLCAILMVAAAALASCHNFDYVDQPCKSDADCEHSLVCDMAAGKCVEPVSSNTGPEPQITSFTATPDSALYGGTTALKAVFTNGTGTIDNGIGAVTSGTPVSTKALSAETTYKLSVKNNVGTATKSVTVGVQTVVVSDITPVNPSVSAGHTVQFTSSVSGAQNVTIDWSATCGTIGADGLYSAPAVTGTCDVTAASHVMPTSKKSTRVDVVAGPAIVSFTADPNPVPYGGKTSLTAVFTDGTGTIDNGIGAVTSGTPVDTGALTLPVTYKLTVINTLSQTVSKELTVNVEDVAVSDISPADSYLTVNKTTQFTTTVTGAADDTVLWSVTGGSIDGNGLFTAPPTPATITVTAKSNARQTAFKQTTVYVVAAPSITSFTANPNPALFGGTSRLAAVFSNGMGVVDNGLGPIIVGLPLETPALTAATTYTLMVTNQAADSVTSQVSVDVLTVAVSDVSPANPYVTVSQNKQFSATVTNAADATIDWSATCGSIDAAGLFTVPATPASCDVTATSHADQTKSKKTGVTVVAEPVITSFTAAKTSLLYDESTTFTAVFSDGTGVVDNAIGTVTSAQVVNIGPLTATTTYTLTVTNAAGTFVTADVTVTVSAVTVSAVTPADPYVTAGATKQFSATASGAVDTVVNWSAGAGTIDATGLFTAPPPAQSGDVTITATSHADPTKQSTTTAHVVAAPDATITAPTYVTSNKVGYTASVPAHSGVTYAWTVTNGAITSGATTNQIIFTAGTTGSMTVSCTVTNQAGTQANGSKSPTVVDAPQITSFTAANPTVDVNASTTLTGAFSGGTGLVDNGVGGVTSGGAKTTGPVVATTKYTLTVTNQAGDSVTADVTVTVVFTVGGTVSNLVGTGLVLVNIGIDDLLISSNGSFVFATKGALGKNYSVTVTTQPSLPAQVCTVTNGFGFISGTNVTDITVTCNAILGFAYAANLGANTVSIYTVNAATGTLIANGSASGVSSPISIALHPTGRFAYVASVSNSVYAFSIDALTGALTVVSGSPFAAGNGPESVTIDPTGRFVYVANYNSDNISAYTVNASTGALTAISGSPFSTGARPASVAVDVTGRFAYSTSALGNTVSAFTINASTGALTAVSGSPFATGANPQSVAVDPTGRFAYVANKDSNNISAYTINASSGALSGVSGSPFAVGQTQPFSVTVDPTGKFAYVANYGSNNVSLFTINPATGALTNVDKFDAGTNPASVGTDPTGKFVFVPNWGGAISAYTINPATGTLTAVTGSPFAAGTGPYSIAVTRTVRFAYVANRGSNTMSAFAVNATTGALSELSGSPYGAGNGPHSITVDRMGRFAYVGNVWSDNVSAYSIDGPTGALTAVSGGPFSAGGTEPYSVAIDRTGRFAYVADYGGPVSGYAVDRSTGALTVVPGSPFSAGADPVSVATDPTSRFAYVANQNSNNVSAFTINPSTGALAAVPGSPFSGGGNPRAVTVDPTGRFAYVANFGSNDISAFAIDASTGALSAVSGSPYPAGTAPASVAVHLSGKFVYVANRDSNSLSAYAIDASTGGLSTISGSPFTTGSSPFSINIDPTGRFAYVPNKDGNNVTLFTIDNSNGALAAVGNFTAGANPASIFTTQ